MVSFLPQENNTIQKLCFYHSYFSFSSLLNNFFCAIFYFPLYIHDCGDSKPPKVSECAKAQFVLLTNISLASQKAVQVCCGVIRTAHPPHHDLFFAFLSASVGEQNIRTGPVETARNKIQQNFSLVDKLPQEILNTQTLLEENETLLQSFEGKPTPDMLVKLDQNLTKIKEELEACAKLKQVTI